LDLAAPKVRKGDHADVAPRNLRRNHVGVERVMERRDLEVKLVRDAEDRLEVIHLIRVDVQPHLAGEHLRQRFQLKVALRRRALLTAFFPGLPLRGVVLGVVEPLPDDRRLAHERRGRLALAPVAALLLLTPGPFRAGGRASELYLIERLPAVELDDGGPAPDIVATAGQDLHRGAPARAGPGAR